MEFCFKSILGLHAIEKRAFSPIHWQDDKLAYLTCIGAGAVLVPLEKGSYEPLHDQQIFYYQSPKPAGPSDQVGTRGSPPRSPESSALAGGHKLARVNKSSCSDGSADAELVAVGEAGGYMPRILLYDMPTGVLLDSARDLHQFGIQHLKFSPSGEYLASLGTPQDGYLYVWRVSERKLTLQASNRCISEVRDLEWLNDTQFVTAGVRFVKTWNIEEGSLLNGRNIVLGEIADQTFERILPLNDFTDSSFLVGTNKGAVYQMPSVALKARDLRRPIKSMAASSSAQSSTLYVGTATNIYEYRDWKREENCGLETAENGLEPAQVYSFGTSAFFALREVFYLSNNAGSVSFRRLGLESNESETKGSPSSPSEAPLTLFQKKGTQMRASRPSAPSLLTWNSDDQLVVRWPNETHNIPLSDITTADHISSEEPNETQLLVGSLSGDIWLGSRRHNAHNGPVTDVHMVHSRLAVSSGRDRCVQVWARAAAEPRAKSPWYLKQTLLFSTPILKAQLCVNESGEVALVCCGANRTVYIYCSSGPLDTVDESAPAFEGSPRSMLMKGMPFDAAGYNELVLLSTNDKMVSVIHPWSDEKIVASWRPYDSNGDSVNLTHLQPLRFADTDLVLGAASSKSVVLFSLLRGELVASQWGLGEPISGVAWTGKEVLAAGDSLIISILRTAEEETGSAAASTSAAPPVIPPSAVARKSPSPPIQSASGSPHYAAHASPSSAVRKVFTSKRSRSVSPVRDQIRSGMSRSPSPPPRSSARSPTLDRGRPGSLNHSPSPERHSIEFKPLRLSNPLHAPLNSAPSPHAGTLLKPQGISASGDPTKQLETALQAFLDKPLSHSDTKPLKSMLLAALNKVDGLTLLDQFTEKLKTELRDSVESQISNSLAEHLKIQGNPKENE